MTFSEGLPRRSSGSLSSQPSPKVPSSLIQAGAVVTAAVDAAPPVGSVTRVAGAAAPPPVPSPSKKNIGRFIYAPPLSPDGPAAAWPARSCELRARLHAERLAASGRGQVACLDPAFPG